MSLLSQYDERCAIVYNIEPADEEDEEDEDDEDEEDEVYGDLAVRDVVDCGAQLSLPV
jgi:hypothetical protein